MATTGRPWASASTQARPNASRRDDSAKPRAASSRAATSDLEAGHVDLAGDAETPRFGFEPRPLRAFAEDDEPRVAIVEPREGAKQRDEILVGDEATERDDGLRPRRQRAGGERFGERRRRGGIVDRADAPFGNDEAGDEIVTQRRRHRHRRRAESGEQRRQAIADAAQKLRLAFAETVVGEDGAIAASGQRRGDRMLEIGDGERRQGRVGPARGDEARERARRLEMAARQNFELDVARQERRRLRRLEIDGEDNGVAARGESRRQSRPYTLGAAVQQRRGIEQQRARRGRRNGHRSSVLAEFAAAWNSYPANGSFRERRQ